MQIIPKFFQFFLKFHFISGFGLRCVLPSLLPLGRRATIGGRWAAKQANGGGARDMKKQTHAMREPAGVRFSPVILHIQAIRLISGYDAGGCFCGN